LLEGIGTVVTFARNREIYGENDSANHLYKVICGAVRTCQPGDFSSATSVAEIVAGVQE